MTRSSRSLLRLVSGRRRRHVDNHVVRELLLVRTPIICAVALIMAALAGLPQSRAGSSFHSPQRLAAVIISPSDENRRLPGPGEYLMATGYIWPLLGFCLVLLFLWRRKQAEASIVAVPTYERSMGSCEPPLGYGIVTVGQAATREVQSPTPPYSEEGTVPPRVFSGSCKGTNMEEVLPKCNMVHDGSQAEEEDEEDEEDEEQDDEEIDENEGPDLITRMGVMTTRKVIEIQRMLVQELEESLIMKVVSEAAIFHAWRCEASTQRVAREFEEEFSQKKEGWENFLTDQEKRSKKQMQEEELTNKQKQTRWQRGLALMLGQWTHDSDCSIIGIVMQVWRESAQRSSSEALQRQRVHSTILGWAEGDEWGFVHLCLKSWHAHSIRAQKEKIQKVEFDKYKKKWEDLLDEKKSSHVNQLETEEEALELQRSRSKRDVELVIAKWGHGQTNGMMQVTLQAWQHYALQTVSSRRQRHAVRVAMMQFCSAKDETSVKDCLFAWSSVMRQERAMRQEHEKWETLLNGEKSRLDEEVASRVDSAKQLKARIHANVELAVRRWELGDINGLLYQVLQQWQAFLVKQALSKRRNESVHASILKWALGDLIGACHNCFIHWKQQTVHRKSARHHEQELKRREEEWTSYMANDRARHHEQIEEAQATEDQMKERARAVVDQLVIQWQLGHDIGLAVKALQMWKLWSEKVRMVSKKQQAVHLALLKSFTDLDSALLHACALNWRALTKHEKLQECNAQRLADEKARWESFVSKESDTHKGDLELLEASADMKAVRGQLATEMMLRSWYSGDAVGLLGGVFSAWSSLSQRCCLIKQRKQAVHTGVVRFCAGAADGNTSAILHSCFLNWKVMTRTECIYRRELQELERPIAQLQERTGEMVSKDLSHLLKYYCALVSDQDHILIVIVLSAWRTQASGIRCSEIQRQLEAELGERQRMHELAVTQRKHTAVSIIRFFGVKDQVSMVMDIFLSWSYHWQQAKQAWAHKIKQNALVTKYAWYMQTQSTKQEKSAILAACFWELLRHARVQRHERERQEAEDQIAENMALILQYQDERNNLEEQLRQAWRQGDNITETLQRELKTKEELAAELKEVYDKIRSQNQPKRTSITDLDILGKPDSRSASRGSSLSSHSQQGRLPARRLGIPGGPGFSLDRPLTSSRSRNQSDNED